MKEQHTFYYYLSQYRLELMGLASLWVVWFHSEIVFPGSLGIFGRGLNFLESIGYGGVDVFLLISGMGIYRSLQKNKFPVFYKHRAKKILPPWWTFLVIYIILGLLGLAVQMNWKEMLGFATFTGFWLNIPNPGNWYVYAIVVFYLISPLLYLVISKSRQKWLFLVLLIAAAYGISILFFHDKRLMAVSRLPMFILGMFISDQAERITIKKASWIVSPVLCLLGFIALYWFETRLAYALWDYGLWWYPFLIIAPCLALLVSGFFNRFSKGIRGLRHFLRILGNASLEILLATDLFFLSLNDNVIIFPDSDGWNKLALMIIGIGAGVLIHAIIEAVKRLLHGHWQKKTV